MARTINRLNPLFVKTVKEPGRYADGGGLYLTTTSGGRRWVFLFRWSGKPTEMGLGSASPGGVTLARARELAAAAREQLAMRINPLEARRSAEALAAERSSAIEAIPSTFGQCADDLISNMMPSWRNPKHAAQWKMTLKEYAASLRGIPVAKVDTAAVLNILQPIWVSKSETASRLRGRIERVLDFAKVKGLREGENPARWRGHLDQVLPARSRLTRGHHAAMPYEAVGCFMARLRARAAVAARALEFLILTAARSGEVLGAQWSEIDLSKAEWTIPPSRMKTGREHRVPLSNPAVELLRELSKISRGRYVFPNQEFGSTVDRPLSTMSMAMLLRRMDAAVTVHGFRSTFRDWASETTGFSHEVCEMALAHTIPNKAEAAYRRGDLFEKRRGLMQAWSDFCGAIAPVGDEA
jgi:integrase